MVAVALEPQDQGDAHPPRVEGEGTSVGEAKWAAMKELERTYPGLDVDHVEFEVLEERPDVGDEGFARVAAAGIRAAGSCRPWPSSPASRPSERQ